MAFNDTKLFNGKRYSGMSVGTGHLWNYPNGVWEETKVADDKWHIRFTSVKCRSKPAPEGSGCALGTGYHWYIMADQCVRKVSKDEYQTLMEGLKFKIGHRRPYWNNWSYTYPEQPTYRQKLIEVLRRTLQQLEADESASVKVQLPSPAQLIMQQAIVRS